MNLTQDLTQKKRKGKLSGKFGKRLREIRTYLELSLPQMAARCSLKQGAICEIESGKRDPLQSSTEDLIINGLRITEAQFYQYRVKPEDLGIKKKK